MSAAALYAAVWRWHFIAGLLVLPFLILLATTGALYLFKDELDALIYRSWDAVPAQSKPRLPAQAIASSVAAVTAGEVLQITMPESDARALRMVVRLPDGEPRSAFVDPYDGHVIGLAHYGGVMQVVRKLHSLQYFGPVASWLIEMAAGWAILLVLSGLYLWWPRGQDGGVLTVRGAPRQRVFWRDVHAVTGILAGAVVLFLGVTGMPWSDVWGGKVQEMAAVSGLGRPAPPAEVVPDWELEKAQPAAAHQHHESPAPQSLWALEKAAPPHSAHTAGSVPIDVDAAQTMLARAGLPRPYNLTLPRGPRGAYMATYSPSRVEDVRVVYLDQYTGAVLDDVGFARFGPAAKAIEWGIAVHQGQEYGPLNRYLMLFGCLAIVVLAVSAITMWWKRRPPASLGVPPRPANPRVLRGLIAIMVPIGLFYPLVGLSFIVALTLERAAALVSRFAPHH